jgi:hypothetical protein
MHVHTWNISMHIHIISFNLYKIYHIYFLLIIISMIYL